MVLSRNFTKVSLRVFFARKQVSLLGNHVRLFAVSPGVCRPTGVEHRAEEKAARDVSSHKVEVNGADIHYTKVGYGNRRVLLIPGALGSGQTDFPYQISNFNRDIFTLYAFDPRGYGKSIPPERTWENFFERDANDAATLMKNIGVDKYSLLGWSDGGMTALIMAARHPENISKIIALGANSFVTEDDIKLYESIRDVNKWSQRMRQPYEDLYGRDYFKNHWNLWIDAISSYYTKGDGDICKKDVERITCPALIVQGQKDPLVPMSHAEYLHKHVKNSSLHVMPEGKHNLHMKFHKEFNSLVEGFLVQ